jgi:hypothetical protein
MLSFRQRLVAAAILTPLFDALLYWIDSDPPYPDVWHTVQEFLIWCVLLFPFMLGLTWFFRKRRIRA